MNKRDNRISLAMGVPGLVIQGVGYYFDHFGDPSTKWLGISVELIGSILFIVGLCYYARAKGRHMAWGLFGLLSFIGLIVLGVLQDRSGQGGQVVGFSAGPSGSASR